MSDIREEFLRDFASSEVSETMLPPNVTELEAAAFSRGWDDAYYGRSDFVRRSLSFETGERQAYMAGRVAGAQAKKEKK